MLESGLSELVKILVSFELRYGMNAVSLLGPTPRKDFFLLLGFARQAITLPSAVRLVLMCFASSRRRPFA